MKCLRFIPILMVFFSSCVYTKITHLDKSEISWMDAYKVSDTIVFYCGASTDTMIIVDKVINNSLFPLSLNEGISEYIANTYFEFYVIHENERIEGTFILEKVSDDKTTISTNISNRYGLNIDMKMHEIRMDNMLFKDCIIIDNNNSHLNNKSVLQIEYFVWSKHYGLIEYKISDGMVYRVGGNEIIKRDKPS